jgi:hypothetical protein
MSFRPAARASGLLLAIAAAALCAAPLVAAASAGASAGGSIASEHLQTRAGLAAFLRTWVAAAPDAAHGGEGGGDTRALAAAAVADDPAVRAAAAALASAPGRPPVMLIPPLAGSQLDWRSDGGGAAAHAPHWFCRSMLRSGAWRLLWLDPLSLLPGFYDCFLQRVSLLDEGGRAWPPPGVQAR